MKIALFGGAFDPIHMGHLAVCKNIFSELPIDLFLFIPSNNHPFKGHCSFFDYEKRCQLIKLAIKDLDLSNKKIEICEIEKENPTENYTYQTLEKLHRKYKNSQLYFLMGMDNLSLIHLWKNLITITELAKIIPFHRKGYETQTILHQIKNNLPSFIYNDLEKNILSLELPEVSSSQIKKLLQTNQSTQQLLPHSVWQEITKNK